MSLALSMNCRSAAGESLASLGAPALTGMLSAFGANLRCFDARFRRTLRCVAIGEIFSWSAFVGEDGEVSNPLLVRFILLRVSSHIL